MLAVVDSGSEVNLMTLELVNNWEIPLKEKKNPYPIVTFEGSGSSYDDGLVTRETEILSIQVQGTKQKVAFDIAKIGQHKAILGLPWLR